MPGLEPDEVLRDRARDRGTRSAAVIISAPRSLVLNVTYEPLSVVASRRAACLILDDKAEIVEHDDGLIRSETVSIPQPLVIRLRYLVKAPFRGPLSVSRRAVFARDDFRCQYCGLVADSIDHVVPRSRGGRHEWSNVVAACRRCNLTKRDRTPAEAGMQLRRPCQAPKHGSWVMVSASRMPDAWRPYLSAYLPAGAG